MSDILDNGPRTSYEVGWEDGYNAAKRNQKPTSYRLPTAIEEEGNPDEYERGWYEGFAKYYGGKGQV
jgi:hypothetical protein